MVPRKRIYVLQNLRKEELLTEHSFIAVENWSVQFLHKVLLQFKAFQCAKENLVPFHQIFPQKKREVFNTHFSKWFQYLNEVMYPNCHKKKLSASQSLYHNCSIHYLNGCSIWYIYWCFYWNVIGLNHPLLFRCTRTPVQWISLLIHLYLLPQLPWLLWSYVIKLEIHLVWLMEYITQILVDTFVFYWENSYKIFPNLFDWVRLTGSDQSHRILCAVFFAFTFFPFKARSHGAILSECDCDKKLVVWMSMILFTWCNCDYHNHICVCDIPHE